MLPTNFSVGALSIFFSIRNWIIVQCNSRDLIGLAVMVYQPISNAHYVKWPQFSLYVQHSGAGYAGKINLIKN